jgi:hypothetical protein
MRIVAAPSAVSNISDLYGVSSSINKIYGFEVYRGVPDPIQVKILTNTPHYSSIYLGWGLTEQIPSSSRPRLSTLREVTRELRRNATSGVELASTRNIFGCPYRYAQPLPDWYIIRVSATSTAHGIRRFAVAS